MKKIFFSRINWVILITLFPISIFSQNPTYLLELRNDVQISPTQYEFDIYIVRTGSVVFEYAGAQFGLIINPQIKNGGTITPAILPGSSDPIFVAANQNPTSILFTDLQNAIKIAGRIPPGAGNGPIIPNVSPGVRICRVQLSNSVAFGQFQPNLTWTTTTVYPTQVNAYVLGLNTPIMVPASQTTGNLLNPILNSGTIPSITSGPANVTVHSTGNVYTTQPGKTNYVWTVSAGGTITSGGTSADNTVTVTWNVATPQTVSINYTDGGVTPPTPTVYPVTVNPATVTVTGITADKVYDGNVSATLNTSAAVLSGVLGGDIVTLNSSGVTGAFADKNVAMNKPVTITGLFTLAGSGAANYILVQPVITGNISQLPLTIANVTANNKVFDGTTVATLNNSTAQLTGVIPGDVVSLNTTSAVGTFSDPAIGTGKTVTTSGYTISGAGALNYSLIQPVTTANIVAAGGPVTITGVTAANKVYDGTTTATLNSASAVLIGVVAPDDVSLVTTGASGTFSDKNSGTGKTVSTSGFTLAGVDAFKYTLVQPVITADITPKPVTVSANTGQTKVYGQADPVFTYTNAPALEAGDSFTGTLSRAAGTNVGSYAYAIGTLSAGTNYSLTLGGTATFSITPKPVVVTANTGQTKVYGQADPVFTYTNAPALEAGDSFTGELSRAAGTNAGSYAYAIGTLSAGTNYTLTLGGTATFSITPKPVVVTANTGQTKVYGQADPVFTYTNAPALEAGDSFTGTLSRAAGTNVGSYAYAIGTLSAGTNYTLTLGGTATFSITPKPVVVTANTGQNKVYGQADPVFTYTNAPALEAGDSFTGALGRAAGTNAGSYAYAIGTLSAGTNYTLTLGGTETFSITPKPVVVTANTGQTKVYGQVDPVFTYTNSPALEAGDSFTGTLSRAAGTNVGSYAYTIGTLSAGTNYTLSIDGSTTFSIYPKMTTIAGVTGSDKVYDGTTAASLNVASATLAGVISPDAVTLNTGAAVGTFADPAVGTGKTVTASGFTITGTDAGNYSLTQPTTTANITPAAITVTNITASNKVYNGNTAATLNTGTAALVGVVAPDVITLNVAGATGTFADKNAGTGKTVTIAGFTISGANAASYTLIQPAATASITPADVTVNSVMAENKVYDGTTLAIVNTAAASLYGVLPGDDVSLSSSSVTGAFADKNAGTAKNVIASDFNLSGADMANYTLIQPVLSADITAKDLLVTANNQSKVYGSALTFTGNEFTATGLVTGDVISSVSISSTGSGATAPAGTYPVIASGASEPNYSITYVNGTLTVNKATLTASADNKTRVYGDQNPLFTVSYSGFKNNENQSVIDVPATAATTAVASSDAGNYNITVSSGADNNYTFLYISGNLTINKADQVITFADIPADLRISQEYQLSGVASSGLTVSFTSSDVFVADVNGDLLTVYKEGTATITASQSGDNNWNPATDVSKNVATMPTFDNTSSLFTPNNDGVNDLWYIPYQQEYGKMNVTVYNRFGKAVYQSDAYKNDWDGTYNGSPLPSASYYYVIKSELKGTVYGVVNIVR